MKKIVIIGAGGHGKVIAEIAAKVGHEEIVFLDDDEQRINCGKYKVIGKISAANSIDADKIVAIGNAQLRKQIQESIPKEKMVTLIHPNAIVSGDVRIGAGTVVMAGAVINPGVTIGKGCIINTSSSVDHDCIIGDYSHVAVGAHICGTVKVGDLVWIGAGAVVTNNVEICDEAFLGAAALVVNDITFPAVYVGAPARMIKNKENSK